MLFAVMGFFKPNTDTEPANLQAAISEHFGQPLLHIRLAGPLRDPNGCRVGIMVLIEAEHFADAERYLRSSPYLEAGLYERVEIVEFDIEVGAGMLRK